MLVPLIEAVPETCGGKAGTLGVLLRAGLPVPDGFVVPFAACPVPDLGPTEEPGAGRQATGAGPLRASLVAALARALGELGDPYVAVRSSAADEDTGQASAAGQYESFLAVRGADEVAGAVRACWASLSSERAAGYRARDGGGPGDLAMAVLVQRHLDAEVSGVMFTPAVAGDPARIEAAWGLGPGVVGGTVTPDAFQVAADGSVSRAVADKRTRLDRRGTRLAVRDVSQRDRRRPAISETTATRLAGFGAEIAVMLGGPQDIEWAVADGRLWILQSRPITAAPPPPRRPNDVHDTPPATSGAPAASTGTPATFTEAPAEIDRTPVTLTGTPGSHGTATGPARIIRGPVDFARVQQGDILVCPFTDPAWTPLLRVAAGVVTEIGGVLSHAAIVAREHAIPAVLGVPDATNRLRDGGAVTIDGTAGTVTQEGRP